MLKPLFSATFKDALALDFADADRARTFFTAGRWIEAVAGALVAVGAVPPIRGGAMIHDTA
jgi:hypothetical protein